MEPSMRVAVFGLAILPTGLAQSYVIEEELPYYLEEVRTKVAYIRERCVLDLYYPESRNEFPTIVWFRGGGLKNGNKSIPEEKAYMMRMMLVAGHQHTRLFELDDYGHAPKEPAYPLILKEAKRILEIMEN